ncbi:MAG: dienelactone hydrolase family protein [Erythrobacter sp.]|nr:dienelactone hydrolase family protein [Erythrobacter sp.]
MNKAMQGYDTWVFEAPIASGRLVKHDIYEKGEGPIVVIIQELPGIGQETLRLADLFITSGFKVVLPHLFGPLGRTSMLGNTLRVLCMRREFSIFAKNKSSPVVDWLKALCRKLKADHGVDGVATIGMCLTGNFAISLMADDAVLASVASQPSLPIGTHGALHMSPDEVKRVRDRLDVEGPMKALRFEGDPLCTAEKFSAIDKAFNDDRERVTTSGVMPGKGHSVLTLDFVDEAGHPTREAFDDVLAYFERKLRPNA